MLRRSSIQPICFAIAAMCACDGARASDQLSLPAGVQAILDRNCVKCHGPLEQNAGLRLDSAAELLRGSDGGAVAKIGDPDGSKLLAVLAPSADPHMPPKKQLTDGEISRLRAWIAAADSLPSPNQTAIQGGMPADSSAAIDHFLAAEWKARGITPAPQCDDRTFIRRVMLDLIGRIPTPKETFAFLFDAAPDKRAALVDRLLASDEAALTFREKWDSLLMGRRGSRREERRREGGWFAFLERAFKEDRPWNEVVQAIITARPTKPEDAGAMWFVYERRNDHQQIAEAIAPVIYGARIDCAQCHDHPLASEIKQEHYWGLVAAFNRSKNTEKGPPAVQESAIGGFINFTNLKKESQPAAMIMLNGSKIEEPQPNSDEDKPERYVDPTAAVRIPKFSRRAVFADAATRANPLLARALVNTTWALLLGRGIVDPPDEMNSRHALSHPQLLDWLSADFAAHDYSVRRLMRAIMLSRAYQHALCTNAQFPSDAFAAALERPLTAESIARSIEIACGSKADDAFRQALIERFPDPPIRAARATIQQTMFLANSDQMASMFEPKADSAVSGSTADDRVRAVFRRALIRDPDAEELAHGAAFLSAHDCSAAAMGQLLWALVSGPEFLTNH
jgi:mono/diheme cytochrome c family protein